MPSSLSFFFIKCRFVEILSFCCSKLTKQAVLLCDFVIDDENETSVDSMRIFHLQQTSALSFVVIFIFSMILLRVYESSMLVWAKDTNYLLKTTTFNDFHENVKICFLKILHSLLLSRLLCVSCHFSFTSFAFCGLKENFSLIFSLPLSFAWSDIEFLVKFSSHSIL